MTTGAYVVIAAVVVALGFGLWRRRTDGRFADTQHAPTEQDEPVTDSLLAGTPWETELGERATLVQFSSAFCAPCRTTRVVLADVADHHDGVRHVEVDAEKHLDLVRALHVTRTPTTIVLDPHGRELGRAAGAPTREQVLRSLPD
ncbi:TlpA family protein disulfide reductase [Nocardioides plantarum]|uniref:TlpA family protein disulfide reductase n=1 Tax=Nocardioides plantarum TaxID=29299 RepID=A0ABV5K6E1_9ACTN|nr:thioredoxin family protein [Nocardioides plantarum]